MAAGGTVSGASEAALRTLAKLDQVMPPRLRGEVAAIHEATQTLEYGQVTVDGDALLALARAFPRPRCGSARLRARDGRRSSDGSSPSASWRPVAGGT